MNNLFNSENQEHASEHFWRASVIKDLHMLRSEIDHSKWGQLKMWLVFFAIIALYFLR